jgi:glycosyltransferase involved in cell wall biosynthesis
MWNGVTCYPRGTHPYGQDVVAAHADHFGADIVVFLLDAYTIDTRLHGDCLRAVPWFSIDHDPLPPRVKAVVAQCWQGIVYSQHAQRAAQAAGLDVLYVPHGVDTQRFSPRERLSARGVLSLSNDAFVVGMVAADRDYASHEAFSACLEGFALFRSLHHDALLYLHASPAGPAVRMDLIELAAALGLTDAVVFADTYAAAMGRNDDYLVNTYNALDVFLSPSTGQGFGIPLLEAQACGCPVIIGEWTSMAEFLFYGHPMPIHDSDRVWTRQGAWQYRPRAAAIAAALSAAFTQRADGRRSADSCRMGALAYDADIVTERHWRPTLDAMFARLTG